METNNNKQATWSNLGAWLAFILYPTIIIGLVIFTLL
jgi:hypothetical protein